MAKSNIEKDIEKMEAVANDDKTPPEVKENLKEAIKEARAQLGNEGKPGKKTTTGKKKIHSSATKKPAKPGSDPLAKCREIIQKYKREGKVENERIKKRKKQGKPAALTVTETLHKTAKVVGDKVKKSVTDKGKITESGMQAAIKQIVEIIKSITDNLTSKKQKVQFIKSLMLAIPKSGVLAEDGLMLEKGDQLNDSPATTRGSNMRILTYRTENFDISPEASQFFNAILEISVDLSASEKHLIIMMAKFADEIFLIVKRTQSFKTATGEEFREAGYYVTEVFYCLGQLAVTLQLQSVENSYPAFLVSYIYSISLLLPGDSSPEMAAFGKRLKSAINRDRAYQSGEPWEEGYERSTDPKHPHYAENGVQLKPGAVGIIVNFSRPLSGGELKSIMSQNVLVTGKDQTLTFVDNNPNKALNEYELKSILHEAIEDNIIVKIVKQSYARGGKLIINPAYKWFALNENNNKIVAGYEYREDVKAFLKDQREANLAENITGYSAGYLKRIKLDPYNPDNWSNDLAEEGTKIENATNDKPIPIASDKSTGKKSSRKSTMAKAKRIAGRSGIGINKKAKGKGKARTQKALFGNILTVNAADAFSIAHDNAGI